MPRMLLKLLIRPGIFSQPTFVFQDHRLYVNEFNERTRRYTKFSNMEAHLKVRLKGSLKGIPPRFYSTTPLRQLGGYTQPSRITCWQVKLSYIKPFFLEFVHREASKGVALSSLANKYQIPERRLLPLGIAIMIYP